MPEHTIVEYSPHAHADGLTRHRSEYTDGEAALIDYLDWKAGVEDPIGHAWPIIELMVGLGWRPIEELAKENTDA